MNPVSSTFSCALPCFPDCSSIELSDTCISTSKAALGVFTGVIFYDVNAQMCEKITSVLTNWGCDMAVDQECIQLLDFLGPWYNPLKILLISYITVFGPILEEVIFREGLHQVIPVNEASLNERVGRAALISIIFGVFHLSTTQGWVQYSDCMRHNPHGSGLSSPS